MDLSRRWLGVLPSGVTLIAIAIKEQNEITVDSFMYENWAEYFRHYMRVNECLSPTLNLTV